MLKDPNFWLSGVTATVAIVALFQTHKQTKVSNKQHLFDKRVEVYLIATGLVELYRENKSEIMNCKDGPVLDNDVKFLFLTNNSYLFEVSKAIEAPFKHPVHKTFLMKMENLKNVATKVRLLFTGFAANILGNFVLCYQEFLSSMYKYEKHLDVMKLTSQKEGIELDECAIRFNDEHCRNEVLTALNNLESAYNELVSNNVLDKIKKQIKLA